MSDVKSHAASFEMLAILGDDHEQVGKMQDATSYYVTSKGREGWALSPWGWRGRRTFSCCKEKYVKEDNIKII